MGAQGIQLPISLQISNLQDIAQQLKQFAGKNILGDSLGGKKIEQELNGILRTLGQIEAKSKNAFTTNADFNSLNRDINKVELGFDRIKSTIADLSLKDLRIPKESQEQITQLNAQMQQLKDGFATFKASQKEKLLANTDFTQGMSQISFDEER